MSYDAGIHHVPQASKQAGNQHLTCLPLSFSAATFPSGLPTTKIPHSPMIIPPTYYVVSPPLSSRGRVKR
ncbi:hypothetical protein P280DRAFT_469593 [Massarina eburnea CBS 473.64]|uniref:Uncharacterized protein n=1 Tax=Massarina eburnea CBS 473.64 TaxID=1395130 RepID=A0A6A6S0M9_9PLEO|nr:hypothetical protein P280DRAFT_469593 [Massarina eburnea CBS 473.64]